MENMEVPQEIKIKLSYNAAVPLLGIYLKKTKLSQRGIHTPMFICNSEDMETT